MGYDRLQFIENIESIKGITIIRDEECEGIRSRVYEGLRGISVIIDITDLDEDVTEGEGRGNLTKLGLEYLIPIFFPTKQLINDVEEVEVEVENQNEESRI